MGTVDSGGSETTVFAASVSSAGETTEADPEFLEQVGEMQEGSEGVVPEEGDSGGVWKLPGAPGW
jgi:hypothetical protein